MRPGERGVVLPCRLPAPHVFTHLETHQTLYFWDFTGLPHVGTMDHCLHFQPFSLLKGMASRAENATLLLVACLSGEQPSSRSHPESTH